MCLKFTILLLISAASTSAIAQNDIKGVVVSGSVQSDVLVPTGSQEDQSHDDLRTNTYVDVNLRSNHIDAGARMEYLEHPLPGFEKDFQGWGVPYFYLKGKLKWGELTLGNYYDQFGSGFIFRSYEERSLGIDNSLCGAHLVLKPVKGIQLKALTGKQRRYWSLNHSWVSGVDVEMSLDQWFKALLLHNTFVTLGASWVNKYEKASQDVIYADPTHQLRLPQYVNAFDFRANIVKNAFSLLGEYASKSQDPSFDNGYIYRQGYVAMLSASYSQRGLSLLLQSKRSDNFSFRSRRSINGTSSFINHLPAFTEDQTYTLAALYPYATHPAGEWAYQAQLGYNFRKQTALGGRYGTNLKVNFSHIHSIQLNQKSSAAYPSLAAGSKATDGYGSSFWKWGNATYYQDLDVLLERRFNRSFKLNFMYMNQFYNKTIVEGEGGLIHSNIFVADAQFRISPKSTLRSEMQYLSTSQDQGDWAFALLEYSLVPHWMFTASDEYNCSTTKAHYWQLFLTYNIKAHRLQFGWGRTRSGYNCSGGVCRYVPESKGFTLSYNYNF